jgi:acyl carrier protein
MTSDTFKTILADLVHCKPEELRETDTRETHAGWSSVVDVQLLALIESDLQIEPDANFLDAFTGCDTVGDLLSLLQEHNAFSDL